MITTTEALKVINVLPGELMARLQSDAWLCKIPVVVADKERVAIELAKRQAMATGLAILVLQVVADGQPEQFAVRSHDLVPRLPGHRAC